MYSAPIFIPANSADTFAVANIITHRLFFTNVTLPHQRPFIKRCVGVLFEKFFYWVVHEREMLTYVMYIGFYLKKKKYDILDMHALRDMSGEELLFDIMYWQSIYALVSTVR
jgi:hypothetical protein